MTSLVKFGRYQVVLVRNEQKIVSLLERLRAAFRTYSQYRVTARQRRQLAQLPDYLLKDIGISRADALNEAEKPFWK